MRSRYLHTRRGPGAVFQRSFLTRHRGSRSETDRSAYVAIGLLVVSLLLMTYDIRSSNRGIGTTLRNAAQYVVAPVQAGANAVVRPVVDFADGVANLAGLRDENERLRTRIAELEREVVRVGHLEERIDQLNVLLGLRLEDNLHELGVAAEVTGRGGTLDPTILVNRGTEDGVHPGQPVLDGSGALIGVVSEASEQTATIIPITSRRAPGVTVRLSNGRRGIVEGAGAESLSLTILNARFPVRKGELLTTFGPYGESVSYPKGLDVGLVADSASPRSGVLSVDVDPIGDIEDVEYVVVIPWPPAPDQLESEAEIPANTEDPVPVDPSTGLEEEGGQ